MKNAKSLLFLLLIIVITAFLIGCASSNSNSSSENSALEVPIITNSTADWGQATITWNAVAGARGYLIWITLDGPGSNSYFCINQALKLNLGQQLTLANLPSINDFVNKGFIIPVNDITYSIPMDLSLSNGLRLYYGQVIYAKVLALGDNASMNKMSAPARITFKNDGHIGIWYYTEPMSVKYIYTLNADGTYAYRVYTWNIAAMNWDTMPTSGDSGIYRIEYGNLTSTSSYIYFTKFKTISAGVELNVTGNIREEPSCYFGICANYNAPYLISINNINYYYSSIP